MKQALWLGVLVGCSGGNGGDPIVIDAENAVYVAFQDGDEPFRQLTLVDGHVEVTSEAGYYGVVRICPDFGNGPGEDPAFRGAIDVRFDTRAQTFTLPCQVASGGGFQTLGGMTAVNAEVSVGFFQTVASTGQYSIDVNPGTHDVVAMLPAETPVMMIVRDVDLSADATLDLPVADEGLAMTMVTPRVTGAMTGVMLFSDLNTANGTYAFLDMDPNTVAIPPASLLVASDGAAVGAFAHDCVAQRPASASMDLVMPAPMTATGGRDRGSFTVDPGVAWEFVRMFTREGAGIAATRISTFAQTSWLEARGISGEVPLVDVTTLPGWTEDLPGFIADGTMMESGIGIVRGRYDGEMDSCDTETTFTW